MFYVIIPNILECLDTIRSQYMDDLNEKVHSFHGFFWYYVDKAIKIYPKTLSLMNAIKNTIMNQF